MLVKFTVVYAPITGSGGSIFYHSFTVTPDGVLSSLSTPHEGVFGLTLPLLENDGRDLEVEISDRSASTRYPLGIGNGDEQHFLVVNQEPVALEAGESLQSTYGWLKPVRVTTEAEALNVFTYPRKRDEPAGSEVSESFVLTGNGFKSVLGRVEETMYIGRHAAGGWGQSLDINGDGQADLVLDKSCGFMAQIRAGNIHALETDTDVIAEINGHKYEIQAFSPLYL